MNTFGVRKVLVIESDPTLKHVWNLIFSRLDYTVTFDWSASGSEVNEKKMSEYDLIVTDLDLWQRHEKNLRNKTLIVTSLESKKIDKLLGDRDYHPFLLHKPLVITECIDLLNWIFSHQPKMFEARLRIRQPELV